jgi:hypothetical protein
MTFSSSLEPTHGLRPCERRNCGDNKSAPHTRKSKGSDLSSEMRNLRSETCLRNFLIASNSGGVFFCLVRRASCTLQARRNAFMSHLRRNVEDCNSNRRKRRGARNIQYMLQGYLRTFRVFFAKKLVTRSNLRSGKRGEENVTNINQISSFVVVGERSGEKGRRNSVLNPRNG